MYECMRYFTSNVYLYWNFHHDIYTCYVTEKVFVIQQRASMSSLLY